MRSHLHALRLPPPGSQLHPEAPTGSQLHPGAPLGTQLHQKRWNLMQAWVCVHEGCLRGFFLAKVEPTPLLNPGMGLLAL